MKVTKSQLTLVFITGLLVGYAIAHRWIVTQAIIGFFIPFLSFFSTTLYIEAGNRTERLKIMLVNAIAYSLGGTILFLMI
jgi:hypothetical protein